MQTIGERLEDARKRKGISIREAAEATKIRGDYLQKFEGNQFDIDLAGIYMRGFLRNYALFLKLPAERIIDDFDALGRADTRPHAPSREVYGRMDLSIASADDRVEHSAVATAEAGSRPGSPLRGHNNLPKQPPIDPALVYKGSIALGVLLVVVLLIWAAKSIMGGSSSASAEARAPASTATESTLTLIAVDNVRVAVTAVGSGKILLPETVLERGQRRSIPFPGPVLVRTDVGANVQFDVGGRLLAIPAGYNQVQLVPPAH